MNGMNVARINCAHDDESVWESLIQLIKRHVLKPENHAEYTWIWQDQNQNEYH